MRRFGLAILLVAVLAMPASAVLTGPVVVDCDLFAKETVTVGSTATSLTRATWAPSAAPAAQCAILTVEADSIRWYADGSTADSSGHLAVVNDVIVLKKTRQIANFSAIRVTGDSTVRVSYGR